VQPVQFQIPKLTTLARHAFPRVLEGTILPLGLFLLFLRIVGIWGAMVAGAVWTYGLVAFRLARKERVPGIVLLGSATLTARTALAMISGSAFVYFLQPSLSTALVASAFLLSVPLGRPLAERLARDFVPIPPDVLADTRVRRFFYQVTLLWAFVQFANAAITIWLLATQSITTFLVVKTFVSYALTISSVAASTFWFHRSMSRHGILVARRARIDGSES
jgi:hypothetical protein